MRKNILTLTLLAMSVVGISNTQPAHADDSYPERAVTIIVPWGAGGGTDAVARILGQQLQEKLGRPFNVVNRTGGNGAVGHSAIVTANPDGYTLGLATTELGMLHWLGLTDITYDDVDAIAQVNADPAAIMVRSDGPYQSLADLEDAIRSGSDGILASGASTGGIWHVSTVGWLLSAGFDANSVKWVPSQGSAPALQDLVAGGVDIVTASLPEAASLIEAGRVKPLAVLANERAALYPDVPTLVEMDRDWTGMAWRGLVAPKGTPEDIVTKLEGIVEEIVNGEVYTDFMGQRGFGIAWQDASGFASFMEQKDTEAGAALSAVGIVE